MVYQFRFQSYHHPFKHSLKTSHGTWNVREGIVLHLIDQSERVGNGEIAPLPWFGTETLEQALNFCQKLPPVLTEASIFEISDSLPACQFGFEMAWEEVRARGQGLGVREQELGVGEDLDDLLDCIAGQSALLPAGEAALASCQSLWQEGYRTFKWKIGVEDLETELAIAKRLAHDLPNLGKLRLDANGGLTVETARVWLEVCDRLPNLEYLEQPLPSSQFSQMMDLSLHYATPLALDESVATLAQLEDCYTQGWRGIFVIKPAIAGSPRRLRQFFQAHAIDAVFSSVFETEIGRRAGLRLAAELGNGDRAMGYGTERWMRG
jgi:O-succinylbenzoate synthase